MSVSPRANCRPRPLIHLRGRGPHLLRDIANCYGKTFAHGITAVRLTVTRPGLPCPTRRRAVSSRLPADPAARARRLPYAIIIGTRIPCHH